MTIAQRTIMGDEIYELCGRLDAKRRPQQTPQAHDATIAIRIAIAAAIPTATDHDLDRAVDNILGLVQRSRAAS